MLTNVPLPLAHEVYIHGDPVFAVEVEPVAGTHVVWCDTPPNSAYVPCRLDVDRVELGDYLAAYERSRQQSPFNQRLYVRRNRPGELLVRRSVRPPDQRGAPEAGAPEADRRRGTPASSAAKRLTGRLCQAHDLNMQGIYKSFDRLLRPPLEAVLARRQSALLLGPRQVGKTTLISSLVEGRPNVLSIPLQEPAVRLELEQDPSLLGRRIAAAPTRPTVFIDEIQKVPDLLDVVQLLIDQRKASFLLTGSSARKLRRAGVNLLPGRIKAYHLDPLTWPELGWAGNGRLHALATPPGRKVLDYSIDDALVFGSLPGIIADTPSDRREFLEAYGRIYLEEEIRAEALVRKMSPFSRFIELAARESGTAPNLTKLSMESGTSVTSIKSYYEILEDTLVIERVEPYLKNARKRLLATPRYYFFDLGVRNAVARLPLEPGLVAAQKGLLFEHAVMLEVIRRVRALRKNYRVHFWRTAGGAEVDCIVDTGAGVIPLEIKAARRVRLAEVTGLVRFLQDYRSVARQGYVVTMGAHAEKLADNILAIPWTEL